MEEEEEEQHTRLIPQHLQGGGGRLQLCLPGGCRVKGLFPRELSSSFPELHNCQRTERRFLKLPSPSALEASPALSPGVRTAAELTLGVHARVSAPTDVALIGPL